ncbi:MAG TPA: AbrB/MazE/SpoVT family DNA-binding domain-containing protein [Thermoanaerobaculia bacterium]|nr:AbrB/MazE/SpoVT family DNA-binding domain-containing protein [Thermoanaerobaculia bacterium]
MSKVTSKYQTTIPRHLAKEIGIKPGDELRWRRLGDRLELVPGSTPERSLSVEERLRIFDASTRRQQNRQRSVKADPGGERGWRREDLYDRGRTR